MFPEELEARFPEDLLSRKVQDELKSAVGDHDASIGVFEVDHRWAVFEEALKKALRLAKRVVVASDLGDVGPLLDRGKVPPVRVSNDERSDRGVAEVAVSADKTTFELPRAEGAANSRSVACAGFHALVGMKKLPHGVLSELLHTST
jgi:hypothetical protein